MEDEQILDLYWGRSEDAIAESDRKYSSYCYIIAQNILHSPQDAEECVNDTWLRAWNAIPPKRPNRLAVFLGKITRNLAIDRFRKQHTERCGDGQLPMCLDELSECVGDGESFEDTVLLRDALNRFLETLKPQTRQIFMLRYWYMLPIHEIAERMQMREGAVKMSLQRTRTALHNYLEQEEIA